MNNLYMLTLKYNIPHGSILKVDCEGCEYDFFGEPTCLISRYDTIIVEYHDTVQHLEDLLRELGFFVSVLGKKKVGLIYARRLR